MALLGTLVNGACIVIGAIIGLVASNMPENIRASILKVNGLFVAVLGIQMALQMKQDQFLIVLISLSIGTLVGELLDIDRQVLRLGHWVESKFSKSESNISKAFVAASILYVVGAMAVVGALNSGLANDHGVLYTKAIIDGVTSIILTSTLGFGVALSAIPVVLYQGSLALMATQIDKFVSPELLDQITSIITVTGGVLIIAIGLNLIEVIKLKVANLLPSLVFCTIIVIALNAFK